MFRNFFTEHVVPDSAAATTYTLAAGTSDKTSGAIDLLGCLECAILIAMGTITATGTCDFKAQHSDDGSSWSDIENGAQTQVVDTMSDKLVGFTVKNPTKRYLRVDINRGTANSVINGIFAFKKYRELPVVQAVTAGQFVAAPEVLFGVTGTA